MAAQTVTFVLNNLFNSLSAPLMFYGREQFTKLNTYVNMQLEIKLPDSKRREQIKFLLYLFAFVIFGLIGLGLQHFELVVEKEANSLLRASIHLGGFLKEIYFSICLIILSALEITQQLMNILAKRTQKIINFFRKKLTIKQKECTEQFKSIIDGIFCIFCALLPKDEGLLLVCVIILVTALLFAAIVKLGSVFDLFSAEKVASFLFSFIIPIYINGWILFLMDLQKYGWKAAASFVNVSICIICAFVVGIFCECIAKYLTIEFSEKFYFLIYCYFCFMAGFLMENYSKAHFFMDFIKCSVVSIIASIIMIKSMSNYGKSHVKKR